MNPLQQKCFAATAGFHLLLVVVLLAGAAFFKPQPARDPAGADQPPITIYPDPAWPGPTPAPVPETHLIPPAARTAGAPTPSANVTPPPPDGKLDLVQVTRNVALPSAREHLEARPQNLPRETFNEVLGHLNQNLTTGTQVSVPGPSAAALADYAAFVKRKYEIAWLPPEDMPSNDANTRVSITIRRDGQVTAARILNRSGDARLDASVQRTLERVIFVAALPEGAGEERTYTINFNLKAKRMLE